MAKNNSFIKKNKNILSCSLLLLITLLLITVIGRSFALGEIATGTSGDCDWVINSEGVLSITPQSSDCTLDSQVSGEMPWSSFSDRITGVTVSSDVKPNSDSSYLFANLTKISELDLRYFDISSVTNYRHMFENIGSDQKEGASLILNDTFTGNFSTSSGYYLPYETYAYTSGVGLSGLHTLAQMKSKVASGGILKWVPAYSVTFDPNSVSGKTASIVIEKPEDEDDEYVPTLTVVQRIGSYIDASSVNPIRKNDSLTKWTDTQDGTSPSIDIEGYHRSTNTYGDNYTSVGTNNKITLYAQYKLSSLKKNVIFLKKDSKTKSPIQGAVFSLNGYPYNTDYPCVNVTATSDASGKVEFKQVPVGKYILKEVTPAVNYRDNNNEFLVKVGEEEEGDWNECN